MRDEDEVREEIARLKLIRGRACRIRYPDILDVARLNEGIRVLEWVLGDAYRVANEPSRGEPA